MPAFHQSCGVRGGSPPGCRTVLVFDAMEAECQRAADDGECFGAVRVDVFTGDSGAWLGVQVGHQRCLLGVGGATNDAAFPGDRIRDDGIFQREVLLS